MDRYSKIINKNSREIVLLKAFPCVWGKCSFCDYIDDNGKDEEELNKALQVAGPTSPSAVSPLADWKLITADK